MIKIDTIFFSRFDGVDKLQIVRSGRYVCEQTNIRGLCKLKDDLCAKVAEIISDIPFDEGGQDYVDIDEAARRIISLITPCATCERRRQWAKQNLEASANHTKDFYENHP